MKKEKEVKLKVFSKRFMESYNPNQINVINFHGMHTNRTRCGIYRIEYGDKFYIGRSKNIYARAKTHRSEAGRLKRDLPDFHYLYKVVQHLKSNPTIQSMDVYILSEGKEDELGVLEQEWLTKVENDENCLNMGFISKPSSNEIRIANFKPKVVSFTHTFMYESSYKDFVNMAARVGIKEEDYLVNKTEEDETETL